MKQKLLNTKTPMVSLMADEGFYVTRKGTPLSEVSGSRETSVPVDEVDQWEEVAVDDVERAKAEAEAERKYKEKVETLIRKKYSQGDEDAIKRKMLATLVEADTLSEHQTESILNEFKEYNAYAEQCKAEARQC